MNQTDLIQKIVAADRQAQAMTRDAREALAHADKTIEQEILDMEQRCQAEADAYLETLRAAQVQSSAQRLSAMDEKLEAALMRMESLYDANRDKWADAIFQRIVGKAGD